MAASISCRWAGVLGNIGSHNGSFLSQSLDPGRKVRPGVGGLRLDEGLIGVGVQQLFKVGDILHRAGDRAHYVGDRLDRLHVAEGESPW